MRFLLPVVLAALPIVASANELPDSPVPKASVELKTRVRWHSFYDRQSKITLAGEFLVNAADQGQTCNNLAHGGHEDFLPTQKCSQVVAIELGMVATGEGLAYLLHRTGHHKLERVPRWYIIGMNVRALAYSKQHGAF